MSDTPNFVLWVDLETDGLGPDPKILELGAILTDKTPAFTEIDRLSIVCRFDLHPAGVDPDSWPVINPIAYEMHRANGLWAECAASTVTERDAAETTCGWLDGHGVPQDEIPLGGSGIDHFDALVLGSRMPTLRKRFTYAGLDIGSPRRFVEIGKGFWPINQEDKPHRALADIEMHLAEARYFMQTVTPAP